MISSELIEQIRQKADIVQVISSYINVIKKGNSYVAICPFHADKNPSLQISRQKQIYKCFVCNAGGNVFNFVEHYEHISYFDAVRKVAEMIGFQDESLSKPVRQVDEKTKNALNALRTATDIYKYVIKSNGGRKCAEYLKKRNISQDMRDYFELGFSPDDPKLTIKMLRSKGIEIEALEDAGILSRMNGEFIDRFHGRLMFPIYNEYNEVIGYSARRITDSDEAKYVNSQNTILFNKSHVLYNYQNARNEAKNAGYVYVTEGFMDVFALYSAGIRSAIALMGTAFTTSHAKMLRRLNVEVRLCLDGDDAGQHGMLAASEILDQEGIKYKIVNYEDCLLDPDELLQQFGPDKLKEVVFNLVSKNQFVFNYFLKRNDLSNAEGKKKFAYDLVPYVSKMTDQIDREMIIKDISFKTGISEATFISLLHNSSENLQKDDNIEEFVPSKNTASPLAARKASRAQIVQKEILYQMLSNNSAIDDMEASNNFLIDRIYVRIQNYIIDLYQGNNDFNVHELITFLEGCNDELSEKMCAIIVDLISSNNHPGYDHQLMEEYIEVLRDVIKKKNYEDFKRTNVIGKPSDAAAKAVADYWKNMKGEN